MKKLLIWVIIIGFLTTPIAGWALNEWTFIVYMAGDDDDPAIEQAQVQNLQALAKVGPKAGVELIIEADRGKKAQSFLAKLFGKKNNESGAFRAVVKQGTWQTEESLGEINTGSPYALWDCLKWATQKHPAKHYFLMINSHGSGVFSWRGDGNVSSSNPGKVNFDPSRFVAYDDTDNDCLTIFEIGEVLKAFRERLNSGRKLDIMGFDACMPGMIEVLYQLRDGCDVLVGSPSTTPITGMDYRSIAWALANNPNIEAEALAKATVESFMKSSYSSNIMGAWRTSKAQELSFTLSNLSMELIKFLKEGRLRFSTSDMLTYGKNNLYCDLGKFLSNLKSGNINLKGASNANLIGQLALEAEEAENACKISVQKSGSLSQKAVGGLGIAWPPPQKYKEYRSFYKALDFSSATKWDEMLDLRELNIE